MNSASYEYLSQDCPNCGKEKAAASGCSLWGHSFMCCSDTCGIAFEHSPERWRLETEKALHDLEIAQRRVAECTRALRAASERKTQP